MLFLCALSLKSPVLLYHTLVSVDRMKTILLVNPLKICLVFHSMYTLVDNNVDFMIERQVYKDDGLFYTSRRTFYIT